MASSLLIYSTILLSFLSKKRNYSGLLDLPLFISFVILRSEMEICFSGWLAWSVPLWFMRVRGTFDLEHWIGMSVKIKENVRQWW